MQALGQHIAELERNMKQMKLDLVCNILFVCKPFYIRIIGIVTMELCDVWFLLFPYYIII
jgi:hypothetical protein